MNIETEIRLLKAKIELEKILLESTGKRMFFFYGWLACTAVFLIVWFIFGG